MSVWRLLHQGEIVEDGDEFLLDDCETWDPAMFAGATWTPAIFVPVRTTRPAPVDEISVLLKELAEGKNDDE